ncbi:hypothetical protein BB559_002105 [Furculomyces boomerangus]|uniref:Grh/CP2 DB domain-containing protein n=2 Tax=Harpellales TaxID=61421 RepID=A0A2T9YY55_9FUNG|nr:hypothetical protein BB559_002105 [Furculomyces boomerangus]PWA02249.1 hypothetical protein BB558_001617 [Smittium angustum]
MNKNTLDGQQNINNFMTQIQECENQKLFSQKLSRQTQLDCISSKDQYPQQEYHNQHLGIYNNETMIGETNHQETNIYENGFKTDYGYYQNFAQTQYTNHGQQQIQDNLNFDQQALQNQNYYCSQQYPYQNIGQIQQFQNYGSLYDTSQNFYFNKYYKPIQESNPERLAGGHIPSMEIPKDQSSAIYHTDGEGYMNQDTLIPEMVTNNPIDSLLGVSLCKSVVNEQGLINNCEIGEEYNKFECALNAQTAITKCDEKYSLTYLNRGQQYMVLIQDKLKSNQELEISIILTFHEEQQRKRAKANWGFWLLQQQNPQNAFAIELDKSKSVGIVGSDQIHTFDRIVTRVHSNEFAKLCVKFNILSTDFSRTKGIKGIPLGVVVSIKAVNTNKIIVNMYCQIKLFRDKGAERKNKDDKKQLNKMLSRIPSRYSGKDGSKQLSMYIRPTRYTRLVPIKFDTESFGTVKDLLKGEIKVLKNPIITTKETLIEPIVPNSIPKQIIPNENNTVLPQTPNGYDGTHNDAGENKKIKISNEEDIPIGTKIITVYDKDFKAENFMVDGIDLNYIPKKIEKEYKLCLYMLFSNEKNYRAIYLENLSAKCLLEEVEKYLKKHNDITCKGMYRETKDGTLRICIDDIVVEKLLDGQDMVVFVEKVSNTECDIKLVF